MSSKSSERVQLVSYIDDNYNPHHIQIINKRIAHGVPSVPGDADLAHYDFDAYPDFNEEDADNINQMLDRLLTGKLDGVHLFNIKTISYREMLNVSFIPTKQAGYIQWDADEIAALKNHLTLRAAQRSAHSYLN